MTISFNQKLIVPSFLSDKRRLDGEGRQLIGLDDLDVTRDVLDIMFLLKSDIEPEDIKYYLMIHEWTPNHIKVFINFTNPLIISQG